MLSNALDLNHELCIRDGPDRPRLVVDKPDTEAYAALSYCWGNSTHSRLKLTTTNIRQLQEFIPVQELARTNHEVLQVASNLGIHYVWIDALCIIQDSKDDWDRESKLMAEVYGNAYLTILAGRASDSSQSFLETTVGEMDPVAIPYANPLDPSAAGEVYVSLSRAGDEGPTSTRAWCFQEKVLSNRMLIYGSGQLKFRCQEHEIAEDGYHTPLTSTMANSMLRRYFELTSQTQQKNILARWYRLVEQYGARDMWDPHDVFLTISGIAQLVEKRLATRYLSGLWENDLIRGLLWLPRCLSSARLFKELERPKATNPRWHEQLGVTVQRAPSWSWASVVGPVTYGFLPADRFDKLFADQSRWRIHLGNSWLAGLELDTPHNLQLYMRGSIVAAKLSGLINDEYRPQMKSLLRRAQSLGMVHSLVSSTGLKAGQVIACAVLDITNELYDHVTCLQLIDSRSSNVAPPIDGLLLIERPDGSYHRIGAMQILDYAFFDSATERELILG